MPNFLSLSRFAKSSDVSPGRQRTQSDARATAPKLFVTSDSSDGETMPASASTPSRRSSQSGGGSGKKPMDRHALSNYYQRRSLTEDDQAFTDDMPTPTVHARAATFQDLQSAQQGLSPISSSDRLRAEAQSSGEISSAERVKQDYARAADDTRRRTASTPALPAAAASAVGDEPDKLPDAWKPVPATPASDSKREKGRSPWRRGSRGPDPSSGIAGALAASGMAIAHPASSSTNLVPPVPPLPTRMRRSPSQVSVQSTSSVEATNKSDSGRGRHQLAQMHAPRASESEVSGSETEDSERMFLDEDAIPVTGFAVASSKRNADFHDLFPQVAEDDYLIEDYGCALQREILVQGRIYISENHLCFHANIFGWVSNEIIPFSEIVVLEKKMTALIIPNAIQVTTRSKTYTFASFMGRDTAYDVMHNIWRLARPPGVESPPRTSLDESNLSAVVGAPGAVVSSSAGVRKVTTCACAENKQHYPTVCLDIVLPGTPEKIYTLLFASGFVKSFLQDEQKLMDMQISDWTPITAGSTLLTRNMSYIKPLTGSFGPKQAKCELRDEMIHFDLDGYITMLTTTRTPEVPSGSAFSVKSRTCITWAGACATRIVVTSAVEWTGSSFIKGLIERSAVDGQKQYYLELEPAARKYIDEHRSEFVPEGMEALAEPEVEAIVASPVSAKTVTELPSSGRQPRDERWLQWALDTFRGASKVAQQSFNGALELLWDVPDTRVVLLGLIAILVATNIASFLAVSRGSTPAPARSVATGAARSEVGDTLRGILEEMRKAAPPAVVEPLPDDWRTETADIARALDAIEERVGRLRKAIHHDTSASSSSS
ncbi:hypothetical protein EXIGLDRAFT_721264 [Exidia glandulosa HHB12029]|uniref:VASt domain-containing protein n=1 Tax=Exidia glandulosa HHB12029 TaxID=1314781 RepID=A0A166BF18_EXIGL|nr:hypothetical protein EXIGLDRAFT_721264 [Exidia glandulosa HHB12029]